MNDVINMPQRESAGLVSQAIERYSAMEIRARVNLVQEVMHGIMKRDTHYGTIPGTPKPTLYKPGAEVLCVTFRIAQEYKIEDLGDSLTARFRVTCVGRHQVTGIVLGEGVGECSSAEEKYKWRGAVCAEEFDLTPESMRRLKFAKYKGSVEKKIQIRTEAADLANTILKMACKRAMIAMTLNVTAASDIFTQDIEDMPEELRNHEAPPATDPALSAKWIAAATSAKDEAGLKKVWTDGLAEIKAAKDMPAYDAFKLAVEAKGKDLKAAAKPADPAAPIEPATPAAVDDFVKGMDAATDDYIPE
jgi:hypothetical protein